MSIQQQTRLIQSRSGHQQDQQSAAGVVAELQTLLDDFAGRELGHALRRRRHAHSCTGELGIVVARRLSAFSDAAMRRVDTLANRIRALGGQAQLALHFESASAREEALDAILTSELIESLASADALKSVERYLGDRDALSLCLVRMLRDEHERELAELSRMLDVLLTEEQERVCA